ncbi:MAG: Asp-tRNA(Asn)/Glu-tRNA(Gln) amidotransferase subunit GatA [Candidatus Calescibacterium sp.]|nr:Asp-tRNA(Asn)/Glu-tRNA(Gln) amidotransferase subunit GatA [Candidatus Calescibacterium sp.]MDW8133299.1 Asp-tRNA(Asn)/Glu-tRNA(Gln) amidotransferase subunit GatA [Candidatus Calescibacterium sp.]
MTAKDILKKFIKREISVKEVVDKYLSKIEEQNKFYNAFISVFDRSFIYEQVERAQKMINESKFTPLVGIPIAIKDNINVKGYPTTCASKILSNYVSPYNATVIEKLYSAGAVIVGKTNLDEFAMGSTNENSFFGIVKNPLDPELVPGGSSGGSAVAVATDMVPLSLGSDTGGSIRLPAAFCGIYGLKPTYGAVSRYGLVAYASSLDQIGPFSKSIEDISLIMQVIAGFDPYDSTSSKDFVPDFVDDSFNIKLSFDSIRGLRIGFPKKIVEDPAVETIIRDSINNLINLLANNGAIIEEIEFPYLEYSIPSYYIIATSEASSNLARYDGVRYGYRDIDSEDVRTMMKKSRGEGFGLEVKRRILAGTFCLSSGYYDAYYKKALQVRNIIKKDFQNIFKHVDFVIMPTSPTLPWKIGEKLTDPIQMYLSDIYTVAVNLAGLPSINFPYYTKHFPVGIQIISNYFQETRIISLSYIISNLIIN